ncbi:hypothetical protein AB395_00001751 [Sinorhizobium fredii CCBAU 45436]|nr:hypothetical protein SF83666_c17080 [Sinorhizobium fredii CCBAU 83666]AWI57405.1 hypothetical protein AB395_00001751 [Sinorhizobium fredii CCBAU 45436]AWM25261.1 hypothetical protein AOX55_00002009 [Sinorhizobium fredii CCBAU 25509]
MPPAVRSPSLCHFHHLLSDAAGAASRPSSRPAFGEFDRTGKLAGPSRHIRTSRSRRGCGLINANRRLGKPSYQKTWAAAVALEFSGTAAQATRSPFLTR